MTRLHLSRIAALTALIAGAGVPAATIAAAPASAATTTYTITDLGSLGGGVTDAAAINAAGQVTGESALNKKTGVFHAFLWSNGKMTDLGTLGGSFSEGLAINDSGEVGGFAAVRGDTSDAALWTGKGPTATDLGGGAVGDVHSINDSGQIVAGISGVSAGPPGALTFQPIPPGFIICAPVGINNNGQVLGNCEASNKVNDWQGTVWTNGTPTVLPTLGGSLANSTTALPLATAINDNGEVVGTAVTSTGALDGFSFSNGTITDLGPTFSPAAINDNGVIVGGQFIDSNGMLQNLNNLIPAGSGFKIRSATGINDNGQIIANAIDTATGQQHALLLTPS
jgi:probable HAF family extracellular repeat protein